MTTGLLSQRSRDILAGHFLPVDTVAKKKLQELAAKLEAKTARELAFQERARVYGEQLAETTGVGRPPVPSPVQGFGPVLRQLNQPLIALEDVARLPSFLQPVGTAAREFTSPTQLAGLALTAGAGPAVSGALRGGTGLVGAARGVAAGALAPIAKGSLATRLAAEAGVGTAATLAGQEVAKRIPETAPLAVRLGAPLAAGLAAGGGAIAAGRAVAPVAGAARRGAAEALVRAPLRPVQEVGLRVAGFKGAIPRGATEPFPPAGTTAPGAPVPELPSSSVQPPGALTPKEQYDRWLAGVQQAERAAPAVPPAPPREPPKPPTGAVPPEPPPSFEQTRDKLIGLIKSAKPVRKETEALYHQRRSQQAAILAKTFEQGEGEAALNRALGSLKGELPKAQFEPPAGLMTNDEVATLYNAIWRTPELRAFERVQAGQAFRQLFDVGAPPTRSGLVLLERVFGPEFVEAVLAKRTFGQKAWEEFMGVMGIPRALKSSIDLSAPLRQGALLLGQPKQFGAAFVDMFKAAASDDGLQALDGAIRAHPQYQRLVDADLYIAPIGRAATLTQREEAFATRLAAKIPGINISQRAYIGFLNSLRSKTFYSYAEQWGDTATPEQYRNLAKFITGASGRGSLGGWERLAPELAQAFFSPRFFMSRLQAPLSLAVDNPFAAVSVSRVAAKNLMTFVGANLGLLSLLSLSGAATVNLDPRSADFGKAKIGNTRIDFAAGYNQIFRFLAMVLSGTGVTGATGRPYEASRLGTAGRFIRSKLAPVPGGVANVLTGRNYAGDEVRWDGRGLRDQAGNLLVPMNVETLFDAVREYGVPGIALAIPSTFGVGVNTYQAYATRSDVAAARKRVTARFYPREKGYGTLSDAQQRRVDRSAEVQKAQSLVEPKKRPPALRPSTLRGRLRPVGATP